MEEVMRMMCNMYKEMRMGKNEWEKKKEYKGDEKRQEGERKKRENVKKAEDKEEKEKWKAEIERE